LKNLLVQASVMLVLPYSLVKYFVSLSFKLVMFIIENGDFSVNDDTSKESFVSAGGKMY